jgi:hypothetical protein
MAARKKGSHSFAIIFGEQHYLHHKSSVLESASSAGIVK